MSWRDRAAQVVRSAGALDTFCRELSGDFPQVSAPENATKPQDGAQDAGATSAQPVTLQAAVTPRSAPAQALELDGSMLVRLDYVTTAPECRGCRHSDRQLLPSRAGRRVWLPVCRQGFRMLLAGYGAENLEIAPPECDKYERLHLTGPGVFH